MTQPAKELCFLVGAPRSGTTWIQRLLQSHPSICGGEEGYFFALFGSALTEADRLVMPEVKMKTGPLVYISHREFEVILSDVWNRIYAELYKNNPHCHIHLDKTPFHALCFDQIKQLFPQSKVVLLTRDSRAVVSSLLHAGHTWGDYWAPTNYYDAALMWYRHIKPALNWRNRNPDHPFLQVRYEDALRDTPAELERILRFLLPNTDNLQIDETLKTFKAREAGTKDPKGFSRKRGTDGWKTDMSIYGKFVTWRYTRKLMRELGYDISIFD